MHEYGRFQSQPKEVLCILSVIGVELETVTLLILRSLLCSLFSVLAVALKSCLGLQSDSRVGHVSNAPGVLDAYVA